MLFTKLIAAVLLTIDGILGFRFFLNAVNLMQTSKYSKTATIIYAIIFLALAAAGFYFLFLKPRMRLALWLSIAPWALIIIGLFINMVTGDYK